MTLTEINRHRRHTGVGQDLQINAEIEIQLSRLTVKPRAFRVDMAGTYSYIVETVGDR